MRDKERQSKRERESGRYIVDMMKQTSDHIQNAGEPGNQKQQSQNAQIPRQLKYIDKFKDKKKEMERDIKIGRYREIYRETERSRERHRERDNRQQREI